MHKNYKSKYSNPNSTDISISTQHIDRKEFSCTISQEKYANKIFQYSKSTKTKKKKKKNKGRHKEDHGMRRDVQRRPKFWKKSARKNSQHDKNKRTMQCSVNGKESKQQKEYL
jgi:hypothetical protein